MFKLGLSGLTDKFLIWLMRWFDFPISILLYRCLKRIGRRDDYSFSDCNINPSYDFGIRYAVFRKSRYSHILDYKILFQGQLVYSKIPGTYGKRWHFDSRRMLIKQLQQRMEYIRTYSVYYEKGKELAYRMRQQDFEYFLQGRLDGSTLWETP